MPTSFAVIGPGKVGQALARRWREAGYRLLGFHGGSAASRTAAVLFAGGESLADWADLARAAVVLMSVPDAAIAPLAEAAANAGAVRPCALWLHASGATSLTALQPLVAAGARIGSLHPLCPFPTVAAGYECMRDRVAVIDGPPASLRLLRVLVRAGGMRPLALAVEDRALYHGACALAANGVTVLHGLATRWLAAAVAPASAGGASPRGEDVQAMVTSLLRGALLACDSLGASAALTGPAARGDVTTLQRHVHAALAAGLPGRDVFVALMRQAATIAQARGDLAASDVAQLVAALEALPRG